MSDNSPDADDLEPEVEYFRNTLELSNTRARDLMIPRAEIEGVDVEDGTDVLQKRFVETGLSKLLVHKDCIDNIIGYVHGNELFRRPRSIRAVMRPVSFVPGTMPADQVLRMFTGQRTDVAVVVDEFGGTAGIVTLEDILEEIVGEIQDEHDTDESLVTEIEPGRFLADARVSIHDLGDIGALNSVNWRRRIQMTDLHSGRPRSAPLSLVVATFRSLRFARLARRVFGLL